MKYLKNLGFQAKLQIFIFALLVILFTISGVAIFYAQKNRVLKSANENVKLFLNDLDDILKISAKHYSLFELNGELYKQLKPIIASKKYFEEGQVYLIQSDGNYLIHSSREGKTGLNENANEIMLKSFLNEGSFEYYDENNDLNFQHYKYFAPFKVYVVITYSQKVLIEPISKNKNMLIIMVIILVAISSALLYMILAPLTKVLKNLNTKLLTLSTGQLVENIEVKTEDDIGKITRSINKLINGLRQTAEFSVQIGEGNLDSDYQPLSNNDVLGNSMLQMRENLRLAAEEQRKRKKEDEERNWVTQGLAKFGDILRTNYSNTNELGEMVIQNMVKYLNANQGGLFQMNDDNESDKYLDLIAAFAYDRKKHLSKKILLGEGLIGACAIEKKSIYMTQVPQGYISITSGLGDASPDCLLIVPLKLEDKIFGVIEIASFRKFEKYEIGFVEKVAESIASTISAVKINARTSALLQQSRQQGEEMAAQEEEMRQNMEELQATQEESARREFELMNLINSLDKHFMRGEFSPEGSLTTANDLFLNSFGYSISGLTDKNIVSFISGENGENFADIWKSVCKGKDFQGMLSGTSKSEEKIWLLMSFTPLYDRDGELSKIISFAKNISFLKEDEVKLREQLKQFEELKNDWQKLLKENRKK